MYLSFSDQTLFYGSIWALRSFIFAQNLILATNIIPLWRCEKNIIMLFFTSIWRSKLSIDREAIVATDPRSQVTRGLSSAANALKLTNSIRNYLTDQIVRRYISGVESNFLAAPHPYKTRPTLPFIKHILTRACFLVLIFTFNFHFVLFWGCFLVPMFTFLSDPGKPGVRSLGPDVTNKQTEVV